MDVCLITGAAGLIGGECVEFFAKKFDRIVGVDNDMRRRFFGDAASTAWNRERLQELCPNFFHHACDIRDQEAIGKLFAEYGEDIKLVIHTAAQPSHDWAAKEPFTDFTVNANGTLDILEHTRLHCPDAVFLFTSTNKVYGDTPNLLPLVEQETRWEVAPSHPFATHGIDESMSIDQSKHSLFGASKVAADMLVQEYGRYFGMKTAVFRGGCLTGPNHSGTQLHGFLSYLVKCAVNGDPYTVFGYKGKQVRDNIHAHDLVRMFDEVYRAPRHGEVYNAGGSRHSHCSMIEAIAITERVVGKKLSHTYAEDNRVGDHIWYVSDVRKFKNHYPNWDYQYGVEDIISQIFEATVKRGA